MRSFTKRALWAAVGAVLGGCSTQVEDMPLPGGAAALAAVDATFVRAGNSAVYTTGNVGIGTTTPAEALHVSGNAKVDGTVFGNAFSSNSPLALQTAGTTRIFVDDVTGNVGIGTTGPTAPLSLVGPGPVQQRIRTTDPAGIAALRLEDVNGITTAEWSHDSTLSETTLRTTTDVGSLNLYQNDNAGVHVSYAGTTSIIGPNGNSFTVGAGNDHMQFIVRVGGAGITRMRLYQGFTRFYGNVGIGREPTANDLEVSGTASKTTAGDWLANSDARIKTDVQTVDKALETLDRVRLVKFRYTPEYCETHPKIADRCYLNVIAQEFREVFPDHVQGSGERLPDGSEILQVDPYPLTIYSAAAVQELHQIVKNQQRVLDEQRGRIGDLQSRIGDLQSRIAELERLVAAMGNMNAK